jgi:hypothetical protein
VTEQRLTLSLQIDRRGAEAPSGRVETPGAKPLPFTGWLGLMAAIRAACEARRPER